MMHFCRHAAVGVRETYFTTEGETVVRRMSSRRLVAWSIRYGGIPDKGEAKHAEALSVSHPMSCQFFPERTGDFDGPSDGRTSADTRKKIMNDTTTVASKGFWQLNADRLPSCD